MGIPFAPKNIAKEDAEDFKMLLKVLLIFLVILYGPLVSLATYMLFFSPV